VIGNAEPVRSILHPPTFGGLGVLNLRDGTVGELGSVAVGHCSIRQVFWVNLASQINGTEEARFVWSAWFVAGGYDLPWSLFSRLRVIFHACVHN
jgi:hypothetical protein